MSNRAILTIIILATLTFAGIVLIQSLWLKNAIQLKEEELGILARNTISETFGSDRSKQAILRSSENEIENLTANQKNKILFTVQKILDSSFHANNIYDSYAFAVMPCSGQNILLSSNPSLNKKLFESKIKSSISDDEASCDRHYMVSVFFTNKNKFLIRQLGSQLILYVLLLFILAGVFAYIIISLRKQKRLSELKNDFINNMTHELKTPIASIRLASRMLKKADSISTKEQNYIHLIDNESCRLESQVDKVLQAAVLDSGNFHLEKTNIDVHDVIIKVASNFRLIAENKNGSIQLDLKAENPIIYADEVHIINVLYNLLDNAIKYCSKPPEIMIATSDDKEGLNISVKDNGIGMSSKAQQYVFEKFYRVETGNVHTVKGFGLGLSYVKSIIDAHKGSIQINSQPNKGSEFNLFFPSL